MPEIDDVIALLINFDEQLTELGEFNSNRALSSDYIRNMHERTQHLIVSLRDLDPWQPKETVYATMAQAEEALAKVLREKAPILSRGL